jgi:hypothetical protein
VTVARADLGARRRKAIRKAAQGFAHELHVGADAVAIQKMTARNFEDRAPAGMADRGRRAAAYIIVIVVLLLVSEAIRASVEVRALQAPHE